jgi:hypothetical protein
MKFLWTRSLSLSLSLSLSSSFLLLFHPLETCHGFSPVQQWNKQSLLTSLLFVEKKFKNHHQNSNYHHQNDDDDDDDDNDDQPLLSRRSMIKVMTTLAATATATATATTTMTTTMAMADTEINSIPSKVVVAGATGQTGRRILERLASMGIANTIVGGVRNVEKAQISLQQSSTVLRGVMIQTISSVDTMTSSSSPIQLQHLDVVEDTVPQLTATLKGATALIIAIGFVPGINPWNMNSAAHAVDNVGTCKLIDAAKASGTVQKIVLVSSILTNGRNWNQESSPGFVVTNAFGNVLDEKIVAEHYLRSSGIDYTIVRPGGLKAKPPTGPLHIYPEDTLNAGEISRDLVADVCIASLTDPNASNKVLEIIEDE